MRGSGTRLRHLNTAHTTNPGMETRHTPQIPLRRRRSRHVRAVCNVSCTRAFREKIHKTRKPESMLGPIDKALLNKALIINKGRINIVHIVSIEVVSIKLSNNR